VYPIPFLHARATKVGSLVFFHKIGCHGNVLEISEKEVQIDHLHPKRFHSVKRLQKLVPSVDGLGYFQTLIFHKVV